MTARLTQSAIQTAVKEVPVARLAQSALVVAVTVTPENSPSLINQLALVTAVRRQFRRLVITTD